MVTKLKEVDVVVVGLGWTGGILGKELALGTILPHIGGGSDVHALPFELNALALIVAGLLLGAAGSGLTLRRFLQV